MSKAAISPPRDPARKPPPSSREAGDGQTVVADASDSTARRRFDWSRALSWKWLFCAVIVGFVLEGAIIHWFRGGTAQPSPRLAGKIPLGVFEFNRWSGRDNRLYRGQFDLFVRLSDHLNVSQQRQFEQQQQPLQQAVEETLRRLRVADFADPLLVRLKNRAQERLNDELGFDAIAEVLITNFTIKATEQTVPPAAPHDDAPPAEKPSPPRPM